MTIKNRIENIVKLQEDYNNGKSPDYNCGGFALNCLNWYLPYEDYYIDIASVYDDFDCGKLSEYAAMKEITNRMVDFMLQDFNNLRLIDSEEDLLEDEYIIAFRIGFADDDFHYCRRTDEGFWYHKTGGGPICKCPFNPYDNFWDCGGLVYEGPMVLLALKRGELNES